MQVARVKICSPEEFDRHSTPYGVECLYNEPQTARAPGTPARHARRSHPPHTAGRAPAWPRHRQTYSADLGRLAPGGDWFFIPGSPSAGGERLDRRLLGAI